MHSFARFLLILSMAVWIGGILFFSFIVAPAIFSVVGNQAAAGHIVSRCIGALHRLGLLCGVVFLASTLLIELKRVRALRIVAGVMILCTAISQFIVTPQMQRIREAVGGAIQALPTVDAGREAFDRLHRFSVSLEGIVLIAGFLALAVIAREWQSQNHLQ